MDPKSVECIGCNGTREMRVLLKSLLVTDIPPQVAVEIPSFLKIFLKQLLENK